MKIKAGILIFLCFSFLIRCNRENSFDASQLNLEWKFRGNDVSGPPQFRASLVLKNGSESELPARNWKLYFSLRYHTPQLASESPDFEIVHESGELFYIRPTSAFKGLPPGASSRMDYNGKRLIANFQDVPSGFFWVNTDDHQTAIAVGKPFISDSTRLTLPNSDAGSIYAKNASIIDLPTDKLPRVFPTPVTYKETAETFELSGSTVIVTEPSFQKEANYLVNELARILVTKPRVAEAGSAGKTIYLKSKKLAAEAYSLSVSSDAIVIEAGDGAGIFYGIQSLKTSISPDAWQKPATAIQVKGLQVNDRPRFPYRAFMLDVARNFQSKEEILKVLEIMSLYKLNVFHFHLTDDEGWRLEVPGIPELTEVGAKRGYPFDKNQQLHPSYGSGPFNQASGTGYYTRQDFIDIVRHAAERHIRIVPEIESPGHARAAIKAMEFRHKKYIDKGDIAEANRYLLSDSADRSTYISAQYFNDNVMNVAMPSTYAFIEKVIDELISMHNEAGAPLTAIHMAGDEVPFGSWEKSPLVSKFLQDNPSIKPGKGLWSHYFDEIKRILRERKLEIYGWQELVVGTQTEGDSKHVIDPAFVSSDLQVDAWWNMYGNEDIPYKLANTGYKTVMTCFDHLYFDLAYSEGFEEPGDAWIGFLDIDRIYSFIPYDYYRNFKTDVRGKPHPAGFFKGKELLTAEGRQNIKGIQGALWAENLVSSQLMEYLLIPRLLALAERAWSPDPAWAQENNAERAEHLHNKALSLFFNTLGKRELPRLDFYNGGIGYRIPTPGATLENGTVVANIQLPGLMVRYTNDGSTPTTDSKAYEGAIAEKGKITLRAFDLRGRGGLTCSILNN